MPQGVVQNDGGLIQAHILKSAFAAPAAAGVSFCLQVSAEVEISLAGKSRHQ